MASSKRNAARPIKAGFKNVKASNARKLAADRARPMRGSGFSPAAAPERRAAASSLKANRAAPLRRSGMVDVRAEEMGQRRAARAAARARGAARKAERDARENARLAAPVPVHVRKTGQWQEARKFLQTMEARYKRACERAVLEEAHYFRREIIKTIDTGGRNAGVSWPSLKPLTIAFKRGKSKPLIDRGDLRGGILVKRDGKSIFVGVPDNVTSGDGTKLAQLAAVHEFGKVIVVPVTAKMIRFFMAKLAKTKGVGASKGTGVMRVGGVMVVRIPERSFLRSTHRKVYSDLAALRRRMGDRIAHEMGPGFDRYVRRT